MVRACRVVGLGVLALVLVGCGGAPSATRTTPVATPAGELIQIGSVSYANWGERDVRDESSRPLDAGDFYFKGTFIRGESGQELTLEIQNVAEQVHNFSLPAQGLDQDIPPKSDRVDVDVRFPQSGGLQFFCKYHTARGMNGLLLAGQATPQSVASPGRGE